MKFNKLSTLLSIVVISLSCLLGDACDGATPDQTTGWTETRQNSEDRFQAARRGMTLQEYREQREYGDE
jgi:hypothetical protein